MAGQENIESAVINIDLLETMKAELEKVDLTVEITEPCTIYRMLPSARNEHSEDYEPKIISIGPLHAEKMAMKSVKWRYLRDLLFRRRDDEHMLERYINKVKELEVQAREKYAEVIGLDSDAFVQLMVVDTYFIIELLIKWEVDWVAVVKENWNPWLLNVDLILLENQIPFFIVQSLYELSNIPGLPDLEKLAISWVTMGSCESAPATKKVDHLLHLYQLSLLPTSTIRTAPSTGHMVMNTIKKIWGVASRFPFWLIISCLFCRLLPLKCWECCQQLTDKERLEPPISIPSATDLEESGVHFKRKMEASSLLDVSFRDGVMEIPLLYIDAGTAPRFRNLIAFEECSRTSQDHFTSYAILLDNLVNTPKDVAILKKCGIIESTLGRDEEVADLFNSLCKGAYLRTNCKIDYLAEFFKNVKQYSEVDCHKWRARLVHDYFGTPWLTISVIAAIILLILTTMQAIYAILAYHKPPK